MKRWKKKKRQKRVIERAKIRDIYNFLIDRLKELEGLKEVRLKAGGVTYVVIDDYEFKE